MRTAADNLNALNPLVSEAMETLNPQPIRELARRCEQAGADLIDINPGYLPRSREDRMAFLIEAVQEACSLGLILDSPDPNLLARGLAVCRDKPILNALTLEGKKLRGILPLAAARQTRLVVLLLDAHSRVAATLEEKLVLALEIRDQALAGGLKEEDLLFDPVLPHLSWPNARDQIKAGIQAVRLLSCGALLGAPAQTMAGLSNLRSGQRHRYPFQAEETCLSLLGGAGLSLILADVLRAGFRQTLTRIREML